MDQTLLTAEQIAKRFGVTIDTVRTWVRLRRITAIRISRKVVRFDLRQLEAELIQPRKVDRDA